MDSQDYELIIKGYKEENSDLKYKIKHLERTINSLRNKNSRLVENLDNRALEEMVDNIENELERIKRLCEDAEESK